MQLPPAVVPIGLKGGGPNSKLLSSFEFFTVPIREVTSCDLSQRRIGRIGVRWHSKVNRRVQAMALDAVHRYGACLNN